MVTTASLDALLKYTVLARAFAEAGRLGRAREMLAEFEAEFPASIRRSVEPDRLAALGAARRGLARVTGESGT